MRFVASNARRGLPAAIVVVGLLAVPATAPATHNTPVEASRTAVPFVTSYLPCTGGGLHDPSSSANDACPAQLRNPNFKFAGKGHLAGYLQVIAAGRPVLPAKFIAPGTVGTDARVFFSGKGLLKNQLPYNGDVFLSNRPRATDEGCAVSCTISDVDGVYPRPAGAPQVCTDGRCLEVFSSNNNLGSLLPGPALPIVDGLRSNAQERGVCLSAALPIPTFAQVFACHGFVAGRAQGAPPAGFDYPRPGKASRTDNVMVRSYKQAVPGPGCTTQTHVAPFNIPGLTDACTAIPESNKLVFGPVGKGTIKMKATSGAANPRWLANIRAFDVRDATTGNPFSGELSYRVTARITHAQCDGGAVCTLPDKRLSIPVSCSNGSCRGSDDLNAQLPSNAISLIEHTPAPLSNGSPEMPCLYDGPVGEPAEAFGCVGAFFP